MLLYVDNSYPAKNRIEKLPLRNLLEGPLKSYLNLAVEMLIDGQPKEISDLWCP